jgi:aldehyde:ferredoxin oxidoreductase
MDAIEHGQVLGMAMEASEKELIRERIGWGDTDKMVELTHMTAAARISATRWRKAPSGQRGPSGTPTSR